MLGAGPAEASSGMSCTSQTSGDQGYMFYCSGSRNVTNPWAQVTCVTTIGNPQSHTVRWTYHGTQFAPFSYGQYVGCGSSIDLADNPVWGPH